jgi:hypothetical protein
LKAISRLFRAKQSLLIVSFPKSGRTWLRVMLDDLDVNARYTHDGADHKELLPISRLQADKSRYRKESVLLVVRDPRDTVVSGYFQVRKRHHLEAGTIGECIRSEEHGIEKVAVFNLHWFSAAESQRKMGIVSYEDLHRDAIGVLREIGKFMGKNFPEKQLAEIVEARSFGRMREAEATGELATRYGNILRPRDASDPESFKVRKGKIGGYVDYLSEADIRYCDEVLARLDYWPALEAAMRKNGLGRPRQVSDMPAGTRNTGR